MTADGRLPPEKRRGYRSALHALYEIAKEKEGGKSFVSRLWKGCSPTVVRAMILNACQLGFYSQAKEVLLKQAKGWFPNPQGFGLHLIASGFSGFCCTVVSLPVDQIKTRLQTMKPGEYSGIVDILVKTVQHEGVTSLWKGFMPYFLRLGPHTVLTFVFLEKLNQYFGKGSSTL